MLEGSGICIFEVPNKIHLEFQGAEAYNTATYSSYVVSKLLDMEDGGMAIFYLHSETEAVFEPLPLFKKPNRNIQKAYLLHNAFGGVGDGTKPTKTTPTRTPRKPAANLVTNPPLSCIPAQ